MRTTPSSHLIVQVVVSAADGTAEGVMALSGLFKTAHRENPEILAIRMGALDSDPGIRPTAHQFVTCAAPWFPVPDNGLPRFPERISASSALPPDA